MSTVSPSALPSAWRWAQLGQIARITTGSADVQDSDPDGEYPFYVRSPEVLRLAHYTHDTEAILTAGDGNVGRIFHHARGRFAVHQRVYILEPGRLVEARYLYYVTSALFFDSLRGETAKSTVESLRRPMLTGFDVPLPSRADQRQIADYLDHETAEIDAFIADLTALSNLAVARTALVESSLFEHALKQSARTSKLSRHATVRSGLALDSTSLATEADSERPVGVFGGNGLIGYTEEPLRTSDSIVIGRVGALCGNVRLVRGPHWVTDNALIVDLRDPSIEIDYLARYLVYLKLNDRADRTAQPLITGGMVSALPLPVPSKEMQRTLADEIARREHRLRGLMSDIDAAIALAKERRAALIAAAVTGQIDVTLKQPPAVDSIQTAIEESR